MDAMAILTEPLPPQKSSPNNVVRYVPECGVVEIQTRRSIDRYTIRPIPSEMGAAFHLAKLTPGTDRTEAGYSVLLGRGGEPDRCGCRGFYAAGRCKHLMALSAIDNRVRSACKLASKLRGESHA